MIKFCTNCSIPILDNSSCNICYGELIEIRGDMRPVFYPEKLLISLLTEKEIQDSIVWAKGSNNYLIDGRNVKIDYVSVVKSQKKIKKVKDEFERLFDPKKEEIYTDNILNFIKANESHFNNIVYEAENYVRETYEDLKTKGYVPVVSFSGGKDSTATSKIVRDALGENRILHFFGDTTLEFDLTHEYIDEFRKENKVTPLLSESSSKNFWDLCSEFGPPSRNERWCCTIFKTGTIGKLMNLMPNDSKALSFVGIRKSESNERSKYSRTRRDSKIKRQIVGMPIIDWLDIDVWLYILTKRILFNKAYYYGFSRVGCWNCPNNSNWSTFLEAIHMNENYHRWRNLLIDYAKNAGKLDYEVYVDQGYWKARRGLHGVDSKKANISSSSCDISDNAKIFFIDKKVELSIVDLFRPFGNLEVIWRDEEYITLKVIGKNREVLFEVEIYLGREYLKVIPIKIQNITLFYKRLECQINKYVYCIGCSSCDNVCSFKAIKTSEKEYIISEKCISCGSCIAYFNNGCLRANKHKNARKR